MTKLPTVVMTYNIFPEIVHSKLKPNAKVVIAKTRSELKKALIRADALISLLSDSIDKELLDYGRNLRVVGNYAVGVDNIDLRECRKRGIAVVNTPGVLTRATAELALTLLLAVARRVPEGEKLCRNNLFKGWKPDLSLGQELKNRHALIVGKGRIGKETAKLFKAIGLRVDWITKADGRKQTALKLRKTQILSLHVPLTKNTKHWLDKQKISLLPKDAIVINTSRGSVIDEKALIAALESRKIFGAGLDVFENEPVIPLRLRRLKNVVLLPHIGSATFKTRKAMADLVICGILSVLRGKRPLNLVQ